MIEKEIVIKNHIRKIENWVDNGGPEEHEWDDFNKWIDILFIDKDKFEFTQDDIKNIQTAFGDSIKIETLQGRSLQKPFGYAGDFIMIDALYTNKLVENEKLMRWDQLVQSINAAKAVRNRKAYFINLLISKLNYYLKGISVLDVASGSCRDLKEFFQIKPDCKINCDCIEQDLNAIDYAKYVLDGDKHKVNFIPKNAIKFDTDKKYDLIWSGGLFDYFTDNIFIRLLKRYYNFLNDNGEMVIGNFSTNNPSKNYMELMEWHLNYRDEDKLLELAEQSGFDMNYVSIGKEPENVNLFLHVNKH
jgi:SAM-dependent methyltransferase